MLKVESLTALQGWLAKLPGIGPKSAARLAYHIIDMPSDEVKQFAQDMYRARVSVRRCEVCGNLTDSERCYICDDSTRDRSTICVVRDFRDVDAIERMREYRGMYHVLGGVISPLDGIGPDELNIKSLIARLNGDVREVILATNPDVRGEATAAYISKLISPLGVKITRIAHGVPIGGELEYTDDATLLKAFEGRREF